DTDSDLPLLTLTAVLSFNEIAGAIELAVPPVAMTCAPLPLLSKVKVLPASAMTNELLLLKVIAPTVSATSSVTVVRLEPVPKVAESPAACGTLGLLSQLTAVDQLPLPLLIQVPVTPLATTVSVTVPPLVEILEAV